MGRNGADQRQPRGYLAQGGRPLGPEAGPGCAVCAAVLQSSPNQGCQKFFFQKSTLLQKKFSKKGEKNFGGPDFFAGAEGAEGKFFDLAKILGPTKK